MSRKLPHFTDPDAIELEDKLVDDGRNIDEGWEYCRRNPLNKGLSLRNTISRSKAKPSLTYPAGKKKPAPPITANRVLKEPVWEFSIPAYFYVGGLTGVSGTLGAAAQLLAPNSMRSLVTRSRWVATIGGAVSAGLLVYDLGRPSRFLNMLRVFRVTSPMSMGSWILSVFSTAAAGAALLPFGPNLFRPVAYPLGLIAGLFGLGLSGYTGVLIAQTAVPVCSNPIGPCLCCFWPPARRPRRRSLSYLPGTSKRGALFNALAWSAR